VFGALLAVGIATTGYGLCVHLPFTLPRIMYRYQLVTVPLRRYQFYSTFTIWPKEIRSDLRAGVKAKHYKDFDMSERYISRYESMQQAINRVIESMPLGLGRLLKRYRSPSTAQTLT
jgi:hypothetical protein